MLRRKHNSPPQSVSPDDVVESSDRNRIQAAMNLPTDPHYALAHRNDAERTLRNVAGLPTSGPEVREAAIAALALFREMEGDQAALEAYANSKHEDSTSSH